MFLLQSKMRQTYFIIDKSVFPYCGYCCAAPVIDILLGVVSSFWREETLMVKCNIKYPSRYNLVGR